MSGLRFSMTAKEARDEGLEIPDKVPDGSICCPGGPPEFSSTPGEGDAINITVKWPAKFAWTEKEYSIGFEAPTSQPITGDTNGKRNDSQNSDANARPYG